MKLLTILGLLLVINMTNSKASSFKNVCYDGQDSSNWNWKQKLEEFAKGPCSPVVIAPGIGASKMRIEINCQELKDNDPITFKECGWSGCSGIHKAPKKEYQIWVPDLLSPMTIVTPLEKNKKCFYGLVGAQYDFIQGKMIYRPKPGVTAGVTGGTPETKNKKDGQCALDGINNLVNGIPNPEASANFAKISKRLIEMGYETGLTLQALPYDFRLNNGMDKMSQGTEAVIRDINKMTNKKVILLAHSMGNLRFSYLLWNMKQEDKDELIENYIAIAPPYSGASMAFLSLTCGLSKYSFPFHTGLDFETFRHSVATFSSMWQLTPFTTYGSQKDKDWMKKIMQRIKYEEGEDDDPVFEFLPTRDQICYPTFPDDSKCRSGVYVFDNYGVTKDGESIDNTNLKEMMMKISFSPIIEKAWVGRDTRYETLENFNVPLTLIYGSRLKTETSYQFKVDPKTFVNEKKEYCTALNGGFKAGHSPGDTMVPSTSVVTLGLKYAYEFDQNIPNAKPVILADVCSEASADNSPFDSVDSNGKKINSKNRYIGIPCDCTHRKTTHCTHTGLLWMPGIVDYLSNSLVTESRSTLKPDIEVKDEVYFDDWVESCRMYTNNVLKTRKEDEEIELTKIML